MAVRHWLKLRDVYKRQGIPRKAVFNIVKSQICDESDCIMGLSQKNEYTDAINTRRYKYMSRKRDEIITYDIPLWNKPIMSVAEAAMYTGLSEEKLKEITNPYACPFVLWMGYHRFIKRKVFDRCV